MQSSKDRRRATGSICKGRLLPRLVLFGTAGALLQLCVRDAAARRAFALAPHGATAPGRMRGTMTRAAGAAREMQPLGDYVLLEVMPAEEATATGLLLAPSAPPAAGLRRGRVRALPSLQGDGDESFDALAAGDNVLWERRGEQAVEREALSDGASELFLVPLGSIKAKLVAGELESFLAARKAPMMEHMNDGHGDSLLAYAKHFAGMREAREAKLADMTVAGMALDVTLEDGTIRSGISVPYSRVPKSGEDFKPIFEEMHAEAYEALGLTEDAD